MWWSEDTRRITRDPVDFAMLMREAAERGITLRTGASVLDPRRDHLVAAVQGGQGHQDSLTRIQAMTGGRLQALVEACPISEHQLPHGVRHARTPDGRKLKRNKVNVAEADVQWHPVLVGALRMLAAGESFVRIGLYLAESGLPRRGQKQPRAATFADLVQDRATLSDTTRALFVNRARTARGLERLYLGKFELWETGVYPYRVANNFPHRGAPVGGFVPTYDGPHDAHGYFDLELNWGTPLTGFDSPEDRHTVIEACRRRVLAERRKPRDATGRDAHDLTVRVLGGGFDRWEATCAADQRWDGETTRYGVTTRTHNSGVDTFIIVHYPAGRGFDEHGREVGLWTFTHHPAEHVAGTFRSAAYCASVGAAIRRAVVDGLLNPDACAPIAFQSLADPSADHRERLVAQIAAQETRCAELEREVKGFRSRAARVEGAGQVEQAEEMWAEADKSSARLDAARTTAARLQADLEVLSTPDPGLATVTANLSQVAYLQAALERAAVANGRGPAGAQRVARQMLGERRFRVREDSVDWTATLNVELADGSQAQVSLAGTIENIRQRTGKALARPDHIARYVMADGLSLDQVALDQAVTRETLIKQRLMPWLVERGVTSRGLKCALVDHPLTQVQRVMWEHLTGQVTGPLLPGPRTYRDHIVATYTNPGALWGDAACLDDLTTIRQALDVLGRRTVPVLDLAHALGVTERVVRGWAAPQPRSSGPTRPRYLEYADPEHSRLRAIRCPHPGCAHRPADHAIPLPEVAATGLGVICRKCRRTPDPTLLHLQLPEDYLASINRTSEDRSLRTSAQTSIE